MKAQDATGKNAIQSTQIDDGGTDTHRWFEDFALGFRFGDSFQERSIGGSDFPRANVVGGALKLAAWQYGIHRVVIDGGYFFFVNSPVKGTEQVRVKTSYQRIDLSVGYEIIWKWLLAGVRVGAALTIVESEYIWSTPKWEIIDTDDDGFGDAVSFLSPEQSDSQNYRGVIPGFLAGVELGFDFGEDVFAIPDLLEFRIASDYVRRDERDEFTLFAYIGFWPSRIFRAVRSPKD